MDQLHDGLRSDIADQVRERFRKAAVNPRGLFAYPTGRAALLALGYPEQALCVLPESVQECYCGVGNPFAAGLPGVGDDVLDVGCGAGVDALVAALQVKNQGQVIGLEFCPEMRERAQMNAALSGIGNATFVAGDAEKLPFADASFDLLLSNGVFNLVLRKHQALAEAFRVLRPGARLQVADQIREQDEPLQACSLEAKGWAA
ncbi:MAG: methyltransferase domain-containing protein [Proteobacteria bacterium]|nr:methyltransferase domain-containing protein [Pseudomonadota bacterium]